MEDIAVCFKGLKSQTLAPPHSRPRLLGEGLGVVSWCPMSGTVSDTVPGVLRAYGSNQGLQDQLWRLEFRVRGCSQPCVFHDQAKVGWERSLGVHI